MPDKSLLSPVQADYSETARYLGYRKTSLPDEQISSLIDECIRELFNVISPQAVYEFFDVETAFPHSVRFADVGIISVDLARNLHGCKKVALLAATIGQQSEGLHCCPACNEETLLQNPKAVQMFFY